jgi:hypothetical protein
VLLTTLLGILAGVLSWWWMGHLPAAQAIAVIVSRMILGFALGISGWHVHWTLHGLVLGLMFSLPQGFWAIGMGWGPWGFISWVLTGAAIGFLIEVFATPLFHNGRVQQPVPSQP